MEHDREENVNFDDIFAVEFKFANGCYFHEEFEVLLWQFNKVMLIKADLILIVIEWLQVGYLGDTLKWIFIKKSCSSHIDRPDIFVGIVLHDDLKGSMTVNELVVL